MAAKENLPNHPKLYDLTKLKEISNGNDAFVQKMIKIFADRLPSSIETIRKSYAEKEFKQLKDILHMLKPGIDHMGISILKDHIREAEKLAAEDPENKLISDHISVIERVLTIVSEQLKNETV